MNQITRFDENKCTLV